MKKHIIGAIIGVALVLVLWHFGARHFTLAEIQHDSIGLKVVVDNHYFFSLFLYAILFAGVIACGLPVLAPLTILASYLFGLIPTIIMTIAACTLGSVVYFLVIRIFLSNVVHGRYSHQLERFNESIAQYGYSYLLTLHLLTVVPFFVINTLAALARVPLVTFALTTAAGSLPIVCVYALAGNELNKISSFRDLIKPQILVILLLLAFFAVVPAIIRKLRKPPKLPPPTPNHNNSVAQ